MQEAAPDARSFCCTSTLLKSASPPALKAWLKQGLTVASGKSSLPCKWGCNWKSASLKITVKECFVSWLEKRTERNSSVGSLTAAIPPARCKVHLLAPLQVLIRFSASDASCVSHVTNRKLLCCCKVWLGEIFYLWRKGACCRLKLHTKFLTNRTSLWHAHTLTLTAHSHGERA